MRRDRPALTIRFALLVAAVTLISSLTLVPIHGHPGPDTTAYAYVGQVILDGGIPYRDARDSKPPLTFYLNAGAIALSGANLWTLWGLRAVTVWITALVFGGLLVDLRLRRWLVRAGVLGLALLLARPVWADLNTPELYALPFQIAALRLGWRSLTPPLRNPAGAYGDMPRQDGFGNPPHDSPPLQSVERGARRVRLLTGIMGGMALLGKQTSGGVLLALGIAFLLWHGVAGLRTRGRDLLRIAVGALIPLAAVALYFAAHGALADAWDATIMYNRYYVVEPVTPGDIVRSALTANDAVTPVYVSLGMFAVAGGIAGLRGESRRRALVLLLALTAIIDMASVNLAATGFAHYFLTPLPAFFALVLVGVEALVSLPWQNAIARGLGWLVPGYVFGLAILIPNLLTLALVVAAWGPEMSSYRDRDPLLDYVRAHTAPGDRVQVWGYLTAANLLTGRRSGSRYFYSHPLTLPDYSGPARLETFLDDLRANRPALIIDATLYHQNKVPPLDPAFEYTYHARGGRRNVPDITPVRAFVFEHCPIEKYLLLDHRLIPVYRCAWD